MVTTFESISFQVTYGIVHLIVDDILQGSYFWELFSHVQKQLHEFLHLNIILNTSHNNQHQFASRGCTHYQVAHHTLVRSQIGERIVVLQGKVTDSVANLVRYVNLQPAFFNRQHFVESSGDMESHHISFIFNSL